MNEFLDIQQALSNLRMSIKEADSSFDDWLLNGNEWADPDWLIQRCFLQLLALVEAMGLVELHKMVLVEYLETKDSEKKFLKAATIPDGCQKPPSLIHLSPQSLTHPGN